MGSDESPPQPLFPTTLRRALLAGAVPLVALILLYLADVPLGQPHLLYRYSPLVPLRLPAALVALLIGGPSLWLLYRGLARAGTDRLVLTALSLVGFAALVLWTYFAPPKYYRQIVFNLESPSHDGAFVIEGRTIDSIRDYVATGFDDRLRLEPEDMLGRRVLSNPPGVTIVSVLCRRFVDGSPRLRAWLTGNLDELREMDDPVMRSNFAADLLLAMLFTLVWGSSLLFGYHLCRLWMPPMAAAAVAFACVFNPATVNFTPGKDPAQLAGVLAILYLYFAACVHRRFFFAFLAGMVFAVATLFGLIHVWILAIALVATLWHTIAGAPGARRWLAGGFLSLVGGGLVVCAAAWLVLDWNILKTALHVGLRYGQIQEGVIAHPFYWTLVGLPLFLLFVGPMPWAQLIAVRTDRADRWTLLAGRILICTIAVMTYAYFFANNNETPRLWIPFIPLLVIPLALRRSLFRDDTRSARRACAVLIALQLTVTVLHWSLMDVRESEYRIFTTQRMWE
jgi:hypothetical protein